MEKFSEGLRSRGITQFEKRFFVDARYLNQQWETEIILPKLNFAEEDTLQKLVEEFHRTHERLYGVKEDDGLLTASEIVKLNDSENSPRALLSEIARTDQ